MGPSTPRTTGKRHVHDGPIRYDDDSGCNVVYGSVVNISPQKMGVSQSFTMPCSYVPKWVGHQMLLILWTCWGTPRFVWPDDFTIQLQIKLRSIQGLESPTGLFFRYNKQVFRKCATWSKFPKVRLWTRPGSRNLVVGKTFVVSQQFWMWSLQIWRGGAASFPSK